MSLADDLTADVWEGATHTQRASIAQDLSFHIGPLWHFRGIEAHTYGARTRHVALWDRTGALFALIPSAEVTLGYDRAHPRTLSDDEIIAWSHTVFFEDIDLYQEEMIHPSVEEIAALMSTHAIPTFAECLDACTTQLRRITMRPFLIEAHAIDITAHHVPEHPGVRTLLPVSHKAACEQLARSEFRLPTSDEWEYACGAGARSLFRWGETCPLDRYPSGSSDPAEAFGPHCGPNAFGLHIAQDPYRWEFCAESNIMRGGDGGGSICGGAGFILGWLPLVSAYVEDIENAEEPIFGVHQRRVRPLLV